MCLSKNNNLRVLAKRQSPSRAATVINGIMGENKTSSLGRTVAPGDNQTFERLLREYFAPAGGR